MWKNIVQPGWPEMTKRRTRIACWVTNPANTNSDYETRNAFPLQQLLHERASMSRYTYDACLKCEVSLHIFYALI
jgi:hypothetical protein